MERQLKKKEVEYSSEKGYTWQPDVKIVISGKEFETLYNTLKSLLNDEINKEQNLFLSQSEEVSHQRPLTEFARHILLYEANNTVDKIFTESIKSGIITEAVTN